MAKQTRNKDIDKQQDFVDQVQDPREMRADLDQKEDSGTVAGSSKKAPLTGRFQEDRNSA